MFRKLTVFTLIAAFAAGAFIVLAPGQASAETATTTKTAVVVKKDPYAYTAQPGDSYSVLARKAVQTYGIRERVRLSHAQIIAAETFLTSDAGFPELEVGQAVTFAKDDVAAAVKQAQNQTAAQLAVWQTYVPYVDFDTRDNG